jgi:hypothetical protein
MFGRGTGPESYIAWSSDSLEFYDYNGSYQFRLITSQVFRDPSAWYHIVVVADTTQATSTNRLKIYVNGVQVTAFSTSTYPSQNYNTTLNANATVYLGRAQFVSTYYDGYMTEINFIDGQALTPNSFGTFNSYGVWQPITYGGSYGTNGFYLPFSQTAPTGTPSVSTSYLVVAGGGGAAGTGGGALGGGGGGGAGGFLTGTTSIAPTSTYVVTVGAGGTAGAATANGSQGANSVFSSITSIGGGGGGAGTSGAGGNGGSGGGGNGSNAVGVTLLGGTATSGQGFNGGNGSTNNDEGGGGGGAGAVGTAGVAATSRGNGGAGLASSISGSSVTYGGGGGGNNTAVGGTGGAGGGGSSPGSQGAGGAGSPNTGGGGAGGYAVSINQAGGAGGSGVVILSYAGAQKFAGGTVTSSGGNTIHTFTTSGLLIYNVTNDFSPNENNWTPNNINVSTLGATYDSMTDVPTLTSATAANFAVLSPIDKGSEVTLANANLSVSWSGVTGHSVRATMGCTSGQWYWEVTSGANASIGLINFALPVVPASGNVWVGGGGFGATGSYGYAPTGLAYTNNTGTSYGASFTTGDVIGVAFDSSAGTLTFYKNGVSQGVAYTGISTSIVYAPAIGYFQPSSGTQNSFNFGQRPFTYTPPTGYVALNTFNL